MMRCYLLNGLEQVTFIYDAVDEDDARAQAAVWSGDNAMAVTLAVGLRKITPTVSNPKPVMDDQPLDKAAPVSISELVA